MKVYQLELWIASLNNLELYNSTEEPLNVDCLHAQLLKTFIMTLGKVPRSKLLPQMHGNCGIGDSQFRKNVADNRTQLFY